MVNPSWLSGETLLLQAVASPFALRVTIEWRGGTEFAFALPGYPYRRLWLSHLKVPAFDNGLDTGRYVGGREATWQVHSVPDVGDSCVVVISQSTKTSRFVLLPRPPSDIQEDDALHVEPYASAAFIVSRLDIEEAAAGKVTPPNEVRPAPCHFSTDQQSHWRVSVGNSTALTIDRRPARLEQLGAAESELDSGALLQFCQDGYLVVRQAAPQDVVDTAKAFVNAQLARLINSAAVSTGALAVGDRLQPVTEDQTSFAEERGADPAGRGGRGALYQAFGASSWQLTALARCAPVQQLVDQLIGHGQVDKSSIGAQVALRFPCVHDDLVASGAAVRTSVSGRDWHTDGMRQLKKHSFSLLLGVAVTDMECEDHGNLCVWPASHFFCHTRMRHPDGQIWRATEDADSRTASAGSWQAGAGPLPDLGLPTQLTLRAGDVVLAHSELAHCGGPHLGPDIRTMVYFRIRHREWARMRKEASLVPDMWVDLEGLRALRREGSLPETPAPEGWQLELVPDTDV